jgi:hypothetical protein
MARRTPHSTLLFCALTTTLALGCMRSEPLDTSGLSATASGTVERASVTTDYTVDYERSSLFVLVLSKEEGDSPMCALASHNHMIEAAVFDAEFVIDEASPEDSSFKVTVPGAALTPDDPAKFDQFPEVEFTDQGDDARSQIKGTAFTELNLDDHPDLVFEVTAPPAVEATDETALLLGEMNGEQGDFEVTYTSGFDGDDFVVNATGDIDITKFGLWSEGTMADCTNPMVPVSVLLTLVPDS